MSSFEGFGPKALPFLKALGFHQDREWFNANRALYVEHLLEPLKALVEALTERFASEGVPLRGDPKASLFRINRDVRFSKDKRPYKTNVSAVMTRTGTKKDIGGVYLHFGLPDDGFEDEGGTGCFLASGAWFPDAAPLRAWREDMVAAPERIFALEDELTAKGYAFGTGGTGGMLTRLPRGFTDVEDERLQGLLRRKGFVINRPLDAGLLSSPALVNDVVEFSHDAMPLLHHYWRIADPLRETNGD